MAAEEEQRLKKKLKVFLDELYQVGATKGFKFFKTYMRGKEECIVSIQNEPRIPVNSTTEMYGSEYPLAPVSNHQFSPGGSFNSKHLPYDKGSLMLSHTTQRQLSGNDEDGVGLPPASPSENELPDGEENSTIFLLAGYARYNCPYAWVRSNHHRLVKVNDLKSEQECKDFPLKLKSTLSWTKKDVHPWNVIYELVKLCTRPAPTNPFEVDFEYFDSLPLWQRVLATGAMVHILQQVVLHDREDRPYTAKVLEELQLILGHHFKAVDQLSSDEDISLMKLANPGIRYHRRQFSAVEKGYHM